MAKVDTSDFALKADVAEIKKKVDSITVDKINSIDELISLSLDINILKY